MAEIIAIDPPPAHQNGSSGPLVADPELEPTFELLITLIHPLKCICTPNKKMKSLKQEPENKGPFNISINIGWDDFLGVIAEKLSVLCTSLAVTSFEWHWLKPASSPWLPIWDKSGFALMLKKVKMKNKLYVIIHMPVPTQRKAAPGNVWDSADKLDFDLGESTVTKKARLDDDIKDIVMKLGVKYPPGNCLAHPDISCFYHHISNLHFKLDCPRCLVWAQAINSGSATYNIAPMLSPMFKAVLALKCLSKSAQGSNTATAAIINTLPTMTNIPPAMQPSMFTQGQVAAMPFINFPQYPQAMFPPTFAQMPLFMNFGAGMLYPGNPFFPPGPGMAFAPTAMTHHSPPSSPPTTSCSVTEFCEMYDLGEHAEAGLKRLGFQFGDNLSSVKQEYEGAGFKTLEWKRVLKAYRKLKHDLH